MRPLFSIYCILTFLDGQVLPTLPDNVFRISVGGNLSESAWEMKDSKFGMESLGKNYFNFGLIDDAARFSSNFDLYHHGSIDLGSSKTIETWLNELNTYYGLSLPVFGSQNIDTTKKYFPSGVFSEKRRKEVISRDIKISYGMSNDVTLHLEVPFLQKYSLEQKFYDYSIGKIDGIQPLLTYHQDNRDGLLQFINSNNFNILNRGERDTLKMIYDMIYTEGGKYSVDWAFHSKDDPLNNLLIGQKFSPPGLQGIDSVSIDDLVSYYYPEKKIGSGIDDVIIGATFLLIGKPSWAINGVGDALYGKFYINIPFGQAISQFLSDGEKQFSQAKIGSGVMRYSVGVYGNKNISARRYYRMFFDGSLQFSSFNTFNTPVALFSGKHTHPDSILNNIGNTYKYDMGTGLRINTGFDIDILKNRLLLRSQITINYKGEDNYVSKMPEWDAWMEEYAGNMPYFSKVELGCEMLFLNSLSSERFGPYPFDLSAGFKSTLSANNTYSDFVLYSTLSTYYQSW